MILKRVFGRIWVRHERSGVRRFDEVEFDEKKVSESKIAQVIKEQGYKVVV